PNGPTVHRIVGPLGRYSDRPAPVPQGGALGWANRRAFGPKTPWQEFLPHPSRLAWLSLRGWTWYTGRHGVDGLHPLPAVRLPVEAYPMNVAGEQHRTILQNIARRVMLERGLLPDFSVEALTELGKIQAPAAIGDGQSHDLRQLLWASIDNDDSRDLDQLTVAAAMPGDKVKILVAVADVDSVVKNSSAIDEHARHNTTSVYTAAAIFSMLPEKLSTDITSLGLHEDRLAIVVEMIVGGDGSVQDSSLYRACVQNQAKLAYDSVAAWLEGGKTPAPVAAVPGLDENLRLQDRVAQGMKNLRQVHGALSFESLETRPIFDGDEIQELKVEKTNRAKDLIADFMIAANGVTARYLSARKFPSLRRVVRTPKRWDRIVELAQQHGFSLPDEPDPRPLEEFLLKQQAADPLRFPDLSLSVIKLMGPGEYVADCPGDASPPGHFGLAVRDYTHSTAPNRRYSDIITQRLLKAALAAQPAPYNNDDLQALAKHCTEEEDAAKKVERQVGKSAAAMLLESRIGEQFDAIVTGAADKGTWVRLLNPPVEGRLVHWFEGLDVGQRARVRLIRTDVEQGFIDFERVG
ncbi:MAG: RNB domain-containing ribonuclease, partial [Thermoguttaceae bacterium]